MRLQLVVALRRAPGAEIELVTGGVRGPDRRQAGGAARRWAGIGCSCRTTPTAMRRRSRSSPRRARSARFAARSTSRSARALGAPAVRDGAVRRIARPRPARGPRRHPALEARQEGAAARRLRRARRGPARRCAEGGAEALAGGAPVAVWIGHATWALRLGGKLIVTDPIWSRSIGGAVRRLVAPGVRARRRCRRSTSCWSATITATTWTCRRCAGCPTSATLRRAARQRGRGSASPTSSSSTGGRQPRDRRRSTITLVPARHWSMRMPWNRNDTLWGGYVMRGPEGTAYHSGDTAWGEHFAEIGARVGAIDWAMLPIGGYAPRWFMAPQHIDPVEAARRPARRSAPGTCWRCTGARSGSPTRRSASRRRGCARTGPSAGSIRRGCGSSIPASRARWRSTGACAVRRVRPRSARSAAALARASNRRRGSARRRARAGAAALAGGRGHQGAQPRQAARAERVERSAAGSRPPRATGTATARRRARSARRCRATIAPTRARAHRGGRHRQADRGGHRARGTSGSGSRSAAPSSTPVPPGSERRGGVERGDAGPRSQRSARSGELRPRAPASAARSPAARSSGRLARARARGRSRARRSAAGIAVRRSAPAATRASGGEQLRAILDDRRRGDRRRAGSRDRPTASARSTTAGPASAPRRAASSRSPRSTAARIAAIAAAAVAATWSQLTRRSSPACVNGGEIAAEKLTG